MASCAQARELSGPPLEVPGEPATSSPPGEGPRHHPAAGDDRETLGFLRLSHDLQDVGKLEFLQSVAQPVAPVPATPSIA